VCGGQAENNEQKKYEQRTFKCKGRNAHDNEPGCRDSECGGPSEWRQSSKWQASAKNELEARRSRSACADPCLKMTRTENHFEIDGSPVQR
jgi:hypothetical protein